jgi:cytochrome c biogenesis protein CcmG, thiol:disulfide interchange protein DsbE
MSPRPSRRSGSWWFFTGGIAVVLLVGVIAVVVSRGDDDTEPGGSAGTTEIAASVALDGQSLPVATNDGADPAVGERGPIARGADFDGNPVSIGDRDRPQLVVFLAHWCPHCQAEVPRIVAFDASGGFPTALEVIAVATGTSADRDNYPPSTWLEAEGWAGTVLVDTANGSVANAYGLSSYPFFVLLDADGSVLARDSGELSDQALRDLVALAVSSMSDEGADPSIGPTP